MSVVAFDPVAFFARYPEFEYAPLGAATLQAYFSEACIYLNNTDTSPVADGSVGGLRSMLLNMLVAHIVQLNATINGVAPSGIVGRVDQAMQGAVSVYADMGTVPGAAAWYMQTKYGAAYWAATASYRTMRYYAGASVTQGYPRWPV